MRGEGGACVGLDGGGRRGDLEVWGLGRVDGWVGPLPVLPRY